MSFLSFDKIQRLNNDLNTNNDLLTVIMNKYDKYIDFSSKKKILKIWRKIDSHLYNEMNSYELNKILNAYSKKNSQAKKLKKIVKVKNIILFEKIIKSSEYGKGIKRLKKKLSNILTGVTDKRLNEVVIKLMSKSSDNYLGYWTMCKYKIDSNGVVQIKHFDIIDKDDYGYIIKNLLSIKGIKLKVSKTHLELLYR